MNPIERTSTSPSGNNYTNNNNSNNNNKISTSPNVYQYSSMNIATPECYRASQNQNHKRSNSLMNGFNFFDPSRTFDSPAAIQRILSKSDSESLSLFPSSSISSCDERSPAAVKAASDAPSPPFPLNKKCRTAAECFQPPTPILTKRMPPRILISTSYPKVTDAAQHLNSKKGKDCESKSIPLRPSSSSTSFPFQGIVNNVSTASYLEFRSHYQPHLKVPTKVEEAVNSDLITIQSWNNCGYIDFANATKLPFSSQTYNQYKAPNTQAPTFPPQSYNLSNHCSITGFDLSSQTFKNYDLPVQKYNITRMTFPRRLMNILDIDNAQFKDILCWLPHGRAFVILDPDALEKEILPRFFKSRYFKSFLRQLSIWEFNRSSISVTNENSWKKKKSNTEKVSAKTNVFYHPLFLRGRAHLALRMRYVKIKSKANNNSEKQQCTVNSVSVDTEQKYGSKAVTKYTTMTQSDFNCLPQMSESGQHQINMRYPPTFPTIVDTRK